MKGEHSLPLLCTIICLCVVAHKSPESAEIIHAVHYSVGAMAIKPIQIDNMIDLSQSIFKMDYPLSNKLTPKAAKMINDNLLSGSELLPALAEIRGVLLVSSPVTVFWNSQTALFEVNTDILGRTVYVNP